MQPLHVHEVHVYRVFMPPVSNIPFASAFAVAHAIPVDDPDLPHALEDYWEHRRRDNEYPDDAIDAVDESCARQRALQSLHTQATSPDEDKRAELIKNDDALALLADLVDQRARIDARVRELTCLFREWSDPAIPLTTLATILRISPGGVRVSYTDETRERVMEITGSRPVTSRDPERAAWIPSRGPSDRYLLGTDPYGKPVTLPYGSPIAILADPDKRETRTLTDLLAHQIVAQEFGELISDDPAAQSCSHQAAWISKRANPDLLASLVAITPNSSQLYGPVTDTFQHGNSRIRLADVLTTFTEGEHISIAPIVAAADAVPPHRSIVVGESLKTVAEVWAAQIPIITGPQRGHDWRWELTIPGAGRSISFRPARTNADWARSFDAELQGVYENLSPADTLARHLVVLLRQTVGASTNRGTA